MSFFLRPAFVWLVLMILCAVVEGLTASLTTIWFAVGAFVMIFLSFLPISIFVQLILFVLISVSALIFTRPFLKKVLYVKRTPTNSDSLIGKTALVVEEVRAFEKGAVKVDGKVWSAKLDATDESVLQKDSYCVIKAIEGVTLVVSPLLR